MFEEDFGTGFTGQFMDGLSIFADNKTDTGAWNFKLVIVTSLQLFFRVIFSRLTIAFFHKFVHGALRRKNVVFGCSTDTQ
jgi:hypothetical protein